MAGRAERLFAELQQDGAVEQLIGRSEDADFDCKEWPERWDPRASIAKAACGFANATGGVIVIGVQAKGDGPNKPDLVRELRPVADTGTVASAALDVILKQVEPGIEGIQVKAIPREQGSMS